jgi:hypothetical protein
MSHTIWPASKATMESAACFAQKRPDHVLTEGGARPQETQQLIWHQNDQFTY